MASGFARTSLRLLGRLWRSAPGKGPGEIPGDPVALDGASAVALLEGMAAEIAGLGATFPATASARAWHRRLLGSGVNALGRPLGAVDAGSPAGGLAAAMGAAMAGLRATAFLSGPDIAGAGDLLARAAGQRLPLVLYLSCRAGGFHAEGLGSWHGALDTVRESGALLLHAANVQEAVDLALVGRRVAEAGLVPVVVAMDVEQTALATQEVRIPGGELIRSFLGDPADAVPPPTPAQRIIFGGPRRRVPRWHDLDRPMLRGPLQDPRSWALGRAGGGPFFDDHIPGLLDAALSGLGDLTGRWRSAVSTHHVDEASTILVAQGAAIETAEAVGEHLRAEERLLIGVVGIRILRPFPAARVAALLGGKRVAAVLERADAPLGGEGPIIREIRAALDRARENARFDTALHPELPALRPKEVPRLVSVTCGMGGAPLRAADLVALCRELAGEPRPRLTLGLDLTPARTTYPKRQALLDMLRREYPDAAAATLRSDAPPPDLRSQGSVAISVHRRAGAAGETIAGEAAGLLYALGGGHLRCRAGVSWRRDGAALVDHVIHSPGFLRDPGDDFPVEIAIVAPQPVPATIDPLDRLEAGGALLLASHRSDAGLWSELPAGLMRRICAADAELHVAPCPGPQAAAGDGESSPALAQEALLGGLLALVQRRGKRENQLRSAVAAREQALDGLSEGDREACLAAFRAGFEGLRRVDPGSRPEVDPAPPELRPAHAPRLLERPRRGDGGADSLPRFWDQVGILYRDGREEELSADPCLSIGAVPALASALMSSVDAEEWLPRFDPASFDGSGACWSACPDGSVAALAIGARSLIDAGIGIAVGNRRAGASALRRLAPRLAAAVNQGVAAAEPPPSSAAEALRTGFDALMEKALVGEEERVSLAEALAAVIAEIGELSIARSAPFFDEPEGVTPGSGELLVIAVNPDLSKSAAAAVAGCEGRGLSLVPRTVEAVEKARRVWRIWEQLPDTRGETIARLRKHPEVGPMAACLLSRSCSMAVAGSDGAEPGSGSRLALRYVLAACESHLQPRVQRRLEEIDELRQRISEAIRSLLAGAIPADDLGALAEGIASFEREAVDLASLLNRIEGAVTGEGVDAARLGRLVEVGRGLADLRWRLAEGRDGLGRARLGLAIAPGSVALWAAAFPHNPFAVPVTVDGSGFTPDVARGLIEGQIGEMIQGIRLVRWARLELDQPDEAPRAAEALGHLRWRELLAEERALAAPLLVVGDDETLGGALSSLTGLLSSDLPVKVVVLSGAGGAADAGRSIDALGSFPPGCRVDLGLLGLLSRRACVLQSSVGDPDHLLLGVEEALEFDGPALLHIHAPGPERHGVPPGRILEQARLATSTRAFPLFGFNPSAAGVFGSCLDLTGNPEPTRAFLEGDDGRLLTPADWAATEERFQEHLQALDDGARSPTPIAEYLLMEEKERREVTPFIVDSEGRRLAVGPVLAADCAHRLRLWRTLQELAGVVTPFTERVRSAAEEEVAKAHTEEVAGLREAYEARFAGLRAECESELAERIRRRLMSLAGYGPGGGNGGSAT
ncbi:MAG: hypothetical protein ACE5GW_00950 [Planctomycetota bacterium]